MTRVYLGLGSNWGERRLEILRAARRKLAEEDQIQIVATSSLYESEPWESEPGTGAGEQRWFLNCVIAIETTLSPSELLQRLQQVETGLGRVRPPGTPEAQRFAPHALDIDILFYGDAVVSVRDELHIPHLLLHEREFVLRPLAELAPELEHPTLYRTVLQLLEDLEGMHEVRPAALPGVWYES